MNRLLISAAHKSSGKTTLTHRPVRRAARARPRRCSRSKRAGLYRSDVAQPASGRPCHNLDFYLMGEDEILRTFARTSRART